MSLLTKPIPNLYGGVSQQSETIRNENQMHVMDNAHVTIVDGCMKRPHTDYVALLNSAATNGAMVHTINRDDEEKYIVIITGSAAEPIEIYTDEGVKCTVQYGTLDEDLVFTSNPAVADYVKTTVHTIKPNQQWKAITIADYTFIVNTRTYAAFTSQVSSGSITGEVATFADLPTEDDDNPPTIGDIFNITGDDTNNFVGYYVRYTGTHWQETIKPGLKYKLNASTMPHRLVRTATNTFTFAPCIWSDRRVGDDETQPTPSFIERRINNILFFRNRLGLLIGDSIYLSRTGRYFDMFIKTALDVLDDDPIDISAATTQVSTLRSVASFNKDLLVFSDEQQFHFGSGSSAILSPKTASFTPTTHYRTVSTSTPVPAGPNVYFPCPREQYTTIREYLVQPDSLLEDAADVTAHVPAYIPLGHIQMTSCSSMDILFVHSDADPNVIYVYKFFWLGTEKVQSSWYRWTFDGEILACVVMGSTLYLVVKRNEVSLEKVELEKVKSGNLDFRVHLDQQVTSTGTYNALTNKTRFTLPYTPVTIDGVIGGIDNNTVLYIQSNDPPVIGEPVPGNDTYTEILVHSDQTSINQVFVDSSQRNRTITAYNFNGKAEHRTNLHKFGASAIRCTSGGRMYIANDSNLNIGHSDFCVDCWLYAAYDEWVNYSYGAPYYNGAFEIFTIYYSTTSYLHFHIHQAEGGKLQFIHRYNSITTSFNTTVPLPVKRWVHVSLSRRNQHWAITFDGVIVGTLESGAYIHNWTDKNVWCGWGSSHKTPYDYWAIWVDELRVSIGASRYAGQSMPVGAKIFQPNNAAYDAVSIHYSQDFKDSSSKKHVITPYGDIYHHNDAYKFPNTSVKIEDYYSYIDVENSQHFNFGASDFTVDFWINFNSTGGSRIMQYGQESGELSWRLTHSSLESFTFSYTTDGVVWDSLTWTDTLSAGIWYHFALVRYGNTLTLYINGVSLGTKVFTATIKTSTEKLRIGSEDVDIVLCHIEELRISNIARWTQPFFPPFGPYDFEIEGFYNGVDGGAGINTTLAEWKGIVVVDPNTGEELKGAEISGLSVDVPGNYEDGNKYILGRIYVMTVQLTSPVMRDGRDNSVITGRLQLRNLSLAHKNTGYYRLNVTPSGRSTFTHVFEADNLQSALKAANGTVSGVEKWMIMSRSPGVKLEIKSRSYKPVELQSGAYQATFTTKARIT